MIPLFVLAIHGADFGWYTMEVARIVATGVFVLAALTDWLDGFLARKLNLISDFGKFMDPLADKVLVMAAMVYLLWLGNISPWVLVVIEGREFLIAGLRMLASQKGVVISAGTTGKLKTIAQMVMIPLVLLNVNHAAAYWIGVVLIYVCVALSIISAVDYMWRNRQIFKEVR